ncbi:hypothetical protein HGRIS_003445 [Hohenbuehelia grisea]|uniref:Uncharacterized protein n=1 Tax=Hohenbuehelia grisea TaxID=104357 RepID=A0ABR3JH23_9AGAR
MSQQFAMPVSSTYPSTSSLLSSASYASSQPLCSASSSKDFSAAFGALQSAYGLGGVSKLPPSNPTPKRQSKLRSVFQTSGSYSSEPSSSRHSTTASSSSSSSSTRPDFEAAFASLSGSYGFAGTMPAIPSKSTKRSSRVSSDAGSSTQKQASEKQAPSKEYQAAFGKLSSLHGFAGRSPSMAYR